MYIASTAAERDHFDLDKNRPDRRVGIHPGNVDIVKA
jgi:hypothetical protein